jgi:hypothetical protein
MIKTTSLIPSFVSPLARAGSVGLSALLAAVLLEGCTSDRVGGCGPGGVMYDATNDVLVSSAALTTAQGDGGGLDCTALCVVNPSFEKALSCQDLGLSDGDGGGGAVAGQHTVQCQLQETSLCEGRRHDAVRSRVVGEGPGEAAAWLDRAARAEASSVLAFRLLHDELAELGAPADLLAACREASADEARHARVMRALAGAAGAAMTTPVVEAAPRRRSLFEVARENAVEGCVHETFAALLGLHQALSAEDGSVRAAMKRIAADEIRHGELAWRIHGWACAQLAAAEARAVEEALQEAAASLGRAPSGSELSDRARRRLGLPSPEIEMHLAVAVRERLWS